MIIRYLQNSNAKLKAENMSLKVGGNNSQKLHHQQLICGGELTPPRSDSSEPSLSPNPVSSPVSPVSSVSSPLNHHHHPQIKEEMEIKTTGLQDHTRLTLCAFLFLFLAFNPLGFVLENAGQINFGLDYGSGRRFEGRVLMEHRGKTVLTSLLKYLLITYLQLTV